jgi:hypothetical protein
MVKNLFIIAALLLAPSVGRAWDSDDAWYNPATGSGPVGAMGSILPGAGGLIATGGTSDHNITCAACHIKAEGRIGVTFTPSPAWSLANNVAAYAPGQTYAITVKLTGEHLGQSGCSPYVNGNINGFGAAFESDAGKPAGTLASDSGQTAANCPQANPQAMSGTTLTYGDCHAIVSLADKTLAGTTSWTFRWTAPPAGTGPVTLFYGAVDGDCMMDSFNVDMYQSSGGKTGIDDVKVGNQRLLEAVASNSPPVNPARPYAYALLALLPAFAAFARKRRS